MIHIHQQWEMKLARTKKLLYGCRSDIYLQKPELIIKFSTMTPEKKHIVFENINFLVIGCRLKYHCLIAPDMTQEYQDHTRRRNAQCELSLFEEKT